VCYWVQGVSGLPPHGILRLLPIPAGLFVCFVGSLVRYYGGGRAGGELLVHHYVFSSRVGVVVVSLDCGDAFSWRRVLPRGDVCPCTANQLCPAPTPLPSSPPLLLLSYSCSCSYSCSSPPCRHLILTLCTFSPHWPTA
jgi:hypothetical protein